MPTLVRLASCTITMYAADHAPPHFHVRAHDGREALVVIETLQVLRGSIGRRERAEALAWAAAHGGVLAAQWKVLNP